MTTKTNKVPSLDEDPCYKITSAEFDAAVKLASLTCEWNISCPGDSDAPMEVVAAHWNEMARLANLFLVSLASRGAPNRL